MRKLFPMLSCADLTESISFYSELLEGRETFRFPEEGDPAYVTLTIGDASEIGLGGMTGRPIHGQAQRPATGHRMELCVYVDDVDRTYARAEEQKRSTVKAPMDTPWGERVAWIADPDGNLVMLTAAV